MQKAKEVIIMKELKKLNLKGGSTMLADNTYVSYCSHWRKYKRKMKETEGTPEFKYWELQLLNMEMKILNGGRKVPEEKKIGVIQNNGGEVEVGVIPAENSRVTALKNAYKLAVKLGDEPMIVRFREELRKLGVEMKDEEPTEPGSGNNAA